MPRRAASENVVKLTKSVVTAAAPEPGRSERILWDSEVPGFGVRVRANGAATWVLRPPRAGGRSALYTLGSAGAVALADARAAARQRLASAALGTDLHSARRDAREKATVTFGRSVELYLAEAAKRRRSAYVASLRNHLNVHWRPLHGRALDRIKRADVAARLVEISAEFGPHAANRARVVLSAFFAWSMGEGIAEANPVLGTNKAADEVARDRVLTDAELAAVWRACRDDDFGRIVRLLILTGQRLNEVAGMRWSELDLAGAVWRLPGERTKNGRAHDVPLSAAALELLSDREPVDDRPFVFGRGKGPFSGFSKCKAALDKAAGLSAPWRLHDLRRTAATGMAGIGVLPHVVEAVLNHVSGHKAGVAGVYNRASYSTEKRAALDQWAAHVLGLADAS
jgi:integrase